MRVRIPGIKLLLAVLLFSCFASGVSSSVQAATSDETNDGYYRLTCNVAGTNISCSYNYTDYYYPSNSWSASGQATSAYTLTAVRFQGRTPTVLHDVCAREDYYLIVLSPRTICWDIIYNANKTLTLASLGVQSDPDADLLVGTNDNCPSDSNTDQLNTDGDSQGNVCDSDDDNDSVIDVSDNCPLNSNSNQLNTDGDSQGNVCDTDDDNDGVADGGDAFPLNVAVSSDSDGDGFANGWNAACDQACQISSGITLDNCPAIANLNQRNNDGDTQGDVCDSDDDNDTIADLTDSYPFDATLSAGNSGILASFYGVGGRPVSEAGDINHDGYADLIIGAAGGNSGFGSVKVIDGRNGSTLLNFIGNNINISFGSAVSSAGDVNNDGYMDVIVGAFQDDSNGTNSGSVWVFSGANGSVLFSWNGDSAGDSFGYSVSAAGDVNGDGYADVIVGATQDDNNGTDSGSARIFSGANGSILYNFYGDSAGDQFGWSVSAMGDVNHDGHADVIVGIPYGDSNGKTTGAARIFSGINGSILYSFYGDSDIDLFGYSVSDAGDVNGDSYVDVIIGAPYDDDNGGQSGSARVLSGKTGGILYTFYGDSGDDLFGFSVSRVGDANNDGYADLIVGSYKDDNNGTDSGSARVLSGLDGHILFVFNGDGAGDYFGQSVSGAGDVNGDGYADVIVGASQDGSARVFSGRSLFIDTDSDGTLDANDSDADGDEVLDINDTYPLNAAESVDTDNDGIGNNADTDDDNDGMPDVWETQYGLNPLVNDASADLDSDGLTNLQEYTNGTNPTTPPVNVKNDYNNDGIAGWIWKGQSNGVETQSQIWQLTFPLLSPNFGVPNRFYPPPFPDQANWEIMTTGDFNKDGDADILWRHKTLATWKVWQMQNGTRVAQNDLADFDLAHAWQVIGVGDTDKDGDDDVILSNGGNGKVLIWQMQDYVAVATHNVGTKAGYVVNRIGDFNKDGDVDLLFRQVGGDVLVTWELQANAFVAERALSNTGTGYNPVCAGDFDNDGDDDIMLVNSATTQEKWFVMENYIRTQVFGATNSGFVFQGCGDYDGDGDMDSLWQRSSDDANRVVLQQNYGVSKQTIYTNAFGGVNPGAAGYGFVYRGNGN